MDARITKQRLSRLLSYDWIKIVGVALAAILVWSLVFTMTATRIRPSQQFSVFNHYANGTLTDDFYSDYNKLISKKVLSYEVIETSINDLASTPSEANTLLEARLATDEGDIMFIPNIMDPTYTEEVDGEKVPLYNYLESFLLGYVRYTYKVDDYFSNLESYLNGFYDGGWEKGTLNEQTLEKVFRDRAKKNKDKRFKKEAEIKTGIANDIIRIQKYRDALVKIYEYEQAGYVTRTEVEIKWDENTSLKGNYAMNICPDENKLPGLKDRVYYAKTVVENDKETTVYTAQDMNIMFFRLSGVESGFEYESLLYLVDLIDKCLP